MTISSWRREGGVRSCSNNNSQEDVREKYGIEVMGEVGRHPSLLRGMEFQERCLSVICCKEFQAQEGQGRLAGTVFSRVVTGAVNLQKIMR